MPFIDTDLIGGYSAIATEVLLPMYGELACAVDRLGVERMRVWRAKNGIDESLALGPQLEKIIERQASGEYKAYEPVFTNEEIDAKARMEAIGAVIIARTKAAGIIPDSREGPTVVEIVDPGVGVSRQTDEARRS